MTGYTADPETGAPLCDDCAAVDHVRACSAAWCQCWCVVESGRVLAMDDREMDKLRVVASELEAERRGSLRDLTAERFQR